jgi:hypothetical protein
VRTEATAARNPSRDGADLQLCHAQNDESLWSLTSQASLDTVTVRSTVRAAQGDADPARGSKPAWSARG